MGGCGRDFHSLPNLLKRKERKPLTSPAIGGKLLFMATQTPWYRKEADRRTQGFQVRIYRDQADYLSQNLGADTSKLLRFLLDSYIEKRTENLFEEFEKVRRII